MLVDVTCAKPQETCSADRCVAVSCTDNVVTISFGPPTPNNVSSDTATPNDVSSDVVTPNDISSDNHSSIMSDLPSRSLLDTFFDHLPWFGGGKQPKDGKRPRKDLQLEAEL